MYVENFSCLQDCDHSFLPADLPGSFGCLEILTQSTQSVQSRNPVPLIFKGIKEEMLDLEKRK
jgi:hypothetical protein